MLPSNKDSFVFTIILCFVALLAGYMKFVSLASWLEAISFVTGSLCVWLTVRENIWNYPLGLLNVVTFAVVFFQARLFADAGLQCVYFVLGIMGWVTWSRRDSFQQKIQISSASARELGWLGCFVLFSTLLLWHFLSLAGGSASFFDGLTTSLSLGAQWLLNRKKLESWIGWILVDMIYVPLYLSRELYLTAILYGIFLVMAILGYRQWSAKWKSSDPSPLKKENGDLQEESARRTSGEVHL